MSAWTYRQSDGKAASKIVPPRLRIPCWKGLGADSEEKREPASDIDTVVVDSLKALDPKWPIREADIIHAGSGNDTIKGNDVADTVHGGSGDTFKGDNGNDTVIGGYGADNRTGSNGNDRFVYSSAAEAGRSI